MVRFALGAFVGVCVGLSAMAANATTIVFSDNFDDGDVTDWVKSSNYGGATTVAVDAGLAVSGSSLFTYLNAPPGGSNLVV